MEGGWNGKAAAGAIDLQISDFGGGKASAVCRGDKRDTGVRSPRLIVK